MKTQIRLLLEEQSDLDLHCLSFCLLLLHVILQWKSKLFDFGIFSILILGVPILLDYSTSKGGGRVVRRCWINFQCSGILLIWIIVGQGPVGLAVGVGGVVWTFFLSSITYLFFLPLSGRRTDIDWNTVSKGRLTQNNQPTNPPAKCLLTAFECRNNYSGQLQLE